MANLRPVMQPADDSDAAPPPPPEHTPAAGVIYFPEDRLPWWRLLPLGLQHVVAMFGATVLAPLLMGFSPQTALLFSGVGTFIFLVITGFKVPSYLGSSFTFIGPVLAVTGGQAARIPQALFGVLVAGLLYGVVAAFTMRFGSRWIDRCMPPVVTGTVVALVGLNLASTSLAATLPAGGALANMADARRVLLAGVTLLTAVAVAAYGRGFLRLLPVLVAVVVGYATALGLGQIDATAWQAIGAAAWFGLPQLTTPQPDLGAALVIAPVFVVLLAENKGHLEAISHCMRRDLSHLLGRTYLGDAVATVVSSVGGGTPQTTYAENMGVMSITRVFSTSIFAVAAGVALVLGLCPKFGAVIMSLPSPIIGAVSILLNGLIALMGVKIWSDARVDFTQAPNLLVAGIPLVIATGLGVQGITVAGLNLAGISLGTLAALLLNMVLAPGAGARPQKLTALSRHGRDEVDA